MSILKEFREFALKGNFVDLAVAVVIGGASGKVVSSIVDKVIMPPLGLVLGKVNFSDLKVVLQEATVDAAGQEVTSEVAIGYGAMIQSFIDFLIVAFIIFMIVRAMNKLKKKEEEAPPPPPPELTTQEKVLMEIRDLLQKGAGTK